MRTTSKLAKLLVVLIGNIVHSLGSTEYAKCMSAREIPGGKVFDEDTALTSLQGSAYYKIFLPEAAALKVSLYTDHDEDGDALAHGHSPSHQLRGRSLRRGACRWQGQQDQVRGPATARTTTTCSRNEHGDGVV